MISLCLYYILSLKKSQHKNFREDGKRMKNLLGKLEQYIGKKVEISILYSKGHDCLTSTQVYKDFNYGLENNYINCYEGERQENIVSFSIDTIKDIYNSTKNDIIGFRIGEVDINICVA
jgi:hypothetical protein